MQNNRVYSAASVTDVINLLNQHRFSGILALRRVTDPHQEEVRISIGYGRPVQIRLGTHEEFFTDATLAWLNSWGAIYFMFQPIESALQLPAPRVPSTPLPPAAVELASPSIRPRRPPSVTQPLPTLSSMVHDQVGHYNIRQANTGARIPATPIPQQRPGSDTQPDYGSKQLFDEPVPTLALEMAVPSMTANGRNYPVTKIPRHDRTIFLLINGQRTVATLAQLTKRTLNDVYTSLYQLKRQELIIVEA